MSDLSPALLEELAKALYREELGTASGLAWNSWDALHPLRRAPYVAKVIELAPILSRALAEAAQEGAEEAIAAGRIVSKARAEKRTEDKAAAWDEGFEQGFEWALHQSTPSGVSIDPPSNPYLTEKEN